MYWVEILRSARVVRVRYSFVSKLDRHQIGTICAVTATTMQRTRRIQLMRIVYVVAGGWPTPYNDRRRRAGLCADFTAAAAQVIDF